VLAECGSKLGEDDVRLASASGCESLLAEFADSIVEPPLRHPAPQAISNRISNSNHGSVVCGIPLTLYFPRGKSGASVGANIRRNVLGSVAMARRRDRDEPPDVLSAEEIKQLRHRIAHLSPEGVRQLYSRAFEDCRLVYTRIPSPRKMQTLVQLWKWTTSI
jgi:hypothetical protein